MYSKASRIGGRNLDMVYVKSTDPETQPSLTSFNKLTHHHLFHYITITPSPPCLPASSHSPPPPLQSPLHYYPRHIHLHFITTTTTTITTFHLSPPPPTYPWDENLGRCPCRGPASSCSDWLGPDSPPPPACPYTGASLGR